MDKRYVRKGVETKDRNGMVWQYNGEIDARNWIGRGGAAVPGQGISIINISMIVINHGPSWTSPPFSPSFALVLDGPWWILERGELHALFGAE